MHYLFVLILILSQSTMASTAKEIEEAKTSILALLSPLVPGQGQKRPKGTEKFSVENCEKHKIDWAKMILTQEEVNLKYTYRKGCDIQGTISPKILQSFPAQLELRHLAHYKQIESMNTITADLGLKTLVNLALRSGVLSGSKGKVRFEADYQVQISPMDSGHPVKDNKGGEIRITEIFGKKVSIKERIMIK